LRWEDKKSWKKGETPTEFGQMVASENNETTCMQFDRLLATALADWPAEIDLSELLRVGDHSRYSVKGLGVMVEMLSVRYIGKAEELIFRNLHQSIHVVLHRIAPHATSIKIANLRSEAIQDHFEICLKDGMSIADMGYSRADIALCNAYFDSNKK
jgi:hypothetical protein